MDYEYRSDLVQGESDVVQQLLGLNLNANSFVWQPWFLQLEGGLGLALSHTNTANNVNADNNGGSSGHITTGHAKLLFLPQSRFPLDLHYERSDSRLSGAVTPTEYSDTNYGVLQRYRTATGGISMLAGHDHDIHDEALNGKDVTDLSRLELTGNTGRQSLSVTDNRQHTVHTQNDSEQSYLRNTLIGRHSFRPNADFSAESIASLIDTNDITLLGLNRSRAFQLGSYAFWRPSMTTTFSGSARYYTWANDGDELKTRTKSINAQAGISHNLAAHLRLIANITTSRNSVVNQQTKSTTESLSLSYQPNPVSLGKFQYRWDMSGTYQNRSGTYDSGRHMGMQIGHALQRSFATVGGGVLMASISQSLSLERDTNENVPQRISHVAALTWQARQSATSLFSRLTASDSRTFNGGEASGEIFQMVNFQLSGSGQLSEHGWLTGNFTSQAVRQVTRERVDTGFQTNSSGSLLYQHKRAFGVRLLRFTSDLRLNADDTSAPVPWSQDKTRSVWENRLDYTIGRTDARFAIRLAKVNGNRRRLILLQIRRRFGN